MLASAAAAVGELLRRLAVHSGDVRHSECQRRGTGDNDRTYAATTCAFNWRRMVRVIRWQAQRRNGGVNTSPGVSSQQKDRRSIIIGVINMNTYSDERIVCAGAADCAYYSDVDRRLLPLERVDTDLICRKVRVSMTQQRNDSLDAPMMTDHPGTDARTIIFAGSSFYRRDAQHDAARRNGDMTGVDEVIYIDTA